MESLPSKDARQRKLTAAILATQKQNEPIHNWPIAEATESDEWESGYRTVAQFMSTDLFTVKPGDLIDLAASLMDWRHIRHVPVEDDNGHLVGLITHRALLRAMSRGVKDLIIVRDIMIENPVTVAPSASSLEAMELMRTNQIGCLPVVENNQLVGIVTSYDFLQASAKLFQKHMSAGA